ncbi:HET-domain-containing protein [Hypoxylon cercidicola]|nr:HET-domain-containing protein [Hypoxylon cercidicola]
MEENIDRIRAWMNTSLTHSLCYACQAGVYSTKGWQAVLDAKEVLSDEPYFRGYRYETTWEASDNAGKGCCPWCQFIAKEIRINNIWVEGSEAWEVWEVWVACEDSSIIPVGEKTLNIVMRLIQGSQKTIRSHYYVYTTIEDGASKYVKAAPAVQNYKARHIKRDLKWKEPNYDLVQKCLDNCMRTHSMCRGGESLLPDRVIDCSGTGTPKLVITDGKQRGSYVALSYVWGGSWQLETTTMNVFKRVIEGFQMSQLPQTIRDAITVTRKLGQRYLWVDALCILQDSEEDKAIQLGAMGHIYRNAYLTINAACARSSYEGFLSHGKSAERPVSQIPYRCPDGTFGTVYIGLLAVLDGAAGASPPWDWDRWAPISQRAWCLQERVLPPRSLIFASTKLKFSCRTATADISGPLCLPHLGLGLPSSIWCQNTSVYQSPKHKEENRAACRRAWLQVVKMYCSRELSLASDKLPALGGVAELFHPIIGGRYLAGLWSKDLLHDLLWKRLDHPRPRPSNYRAPSWSWAATDGEVDAYYFDSSKSTVAGHSLCMAKILECRVELASEHAPFGGVKDGVLKLKGGVKAAVVTRMEWRVYKNVFYKGPDGNMVRIGELMFDASDESLGFDACVIPLVWDARGSFFEAIVVVRATKDQYRRIGRVSKDSTSDVKWLHDLHVQETVIV